MFSRDEKAKIVNALGAMFDVFGKEKNEIAMLAYIGALDGIPAQQVLAGIVAAMQQCKYMPVPADIRERCGVSVKGDANKAWALVVKTASSVGARVWVQFDDPRIVPAIRESAGTWSNLCRMSADQLPYVKNSFVEAYGRAVVSGKPETLAGEGKDETPHLIAESGRVERLALPAPAPTRLLEESSTPNVDREQLAALAKLRKNIDVFGGRDE